jgi:hypothetical protein
MEVNFNTYKPKTETHYSQLFGGKSTHPRLFYATDKTSWVRGSLSDA